MTTIITNCSDGNRSILVNGRRINKPPRRSPRWTPECVALLRRLWPTHSATQIAKKLDRGFTRMAVIGKAHRLNLRVKIPAHTESGGKRKTARKR